MSPEIREETPFSRIDILSLALLGSSLADAMTAFGALPLFAMRQQPHMRMEPLLAFAAGAMLYVISHEVIPETHRKGTRTAATFALMVGFCLMMLLDVVLA